MSESSAMVVDGNAAAKLTLQVPEELREQVGIADGELLIARAYQSRPDVMSFQQRARRLCPEIVVRIVELEELQTLEGQADDDRAQRLLGSRAEVTGLLRRAVARGASDIHIRVGDARTSIWYRIHGELVPTLQVSRDDGLMLCSTIYQGMCDVSKPHYNPLRPQDARLGEDVVRELGLYGARISTRPTDKGTLMVMRLLPGIKQMRPLEEMGFVPSQVEMMKAALWRRRGIMVLSGPTGSGKSTTLQAAMSWLLRETGQGIHLITAEHPPEYEIAGAVQTPIQVVDENDRGAVKRAWSEAITNFMRLNPDYIMVGEVRDGASASAAFDAAMTGHGVATTLHVTDATMIPARLRELGIADDLLFDPQLLHLLVNQSLVPTVCPHCATPWPFGESGNTELEARLQALVERTPGGRRETIRARGEGCDSCHRGINGRIVIAEMIAPDYAFMEIFRTRGKHPARRHWLTKLGGISKSALLGQRILDGTLDPALAERETGTRIGDDEQLLASEESFS
ncbi:ATPase, T2SS/T4P/T4SS family [Salinicola endophyticus]|uniref:ATPase, T2SS/T4P/T4SS family n=1 Tax=Salinicola endophyticus TaxID=1949083 RepID=A0AB74UFW1_9GAMM